ncbi:MAG: hypothetical protein PVJ17_14080 [Lysobacterales bacterium]|jgi:hypothetical protein
MNRLGKWSASILAIGGIAYAIVVVIGMVSYGLERPIGGIVLVVMEMLTLLLALVFLVMMAAIHSSAALEWKTNTLVALVFAALLAGISATVHFVQLTALRQLGTAGLVWPSPMYAAELLAWDVFLGLSLLFAAPSLRGNRLRQVARTTMTACGAMCLIGVLGPATGYMGLQFLAVAGYGLVLPVLCVLLALNWSRTGGA